MDFFSNLKNCKQSVTDNVLRSTDGSHANMIDLFEM